MNKKVAFLTTIFPMNQIYLDEFFNSLNKQTYNNFDLIIINDGYPKLEELHKQYTRINIIEISGVDCISKNREIGINYTILNNYDILVFGDSDDYFDMNRIERVVSTFDSLTYDIIVNDLTLFNNSNVLEQKYISNRIDNLSIIDYDFIKDKNIFGLSNTAILLKNIDPISFPEDLKVVDWYFFSKLLLEGKRAIFINDIQTYYRQHEDNIIGLKKLTKDSFFQGVSVKKKNYSYLLNDFKYDFFNKEIERLSKGNYCYRNNNDYPLWWELI